jgi:hypothetical protein
MTLENLRYLVGALYRLCLLAVMFAVLWVKGYFWLIFGAALALFLISWVMMHVVMEMAQNARLAGVAAVEESDEDDTPPMPPPKPLRARSD